mgnify:CR=1 FL=1
MQILYRALDKLVEKVQNGEIFNGEKEFKIDSKNPFEDGS